MKHELDALEANDTWELPVFSAIKKAIDLKWVYKSKLKSGGTVGTCKERVVAKGYHQVMSIDQLVVSHAAKLVSVLLFLAIASGKSWPTHQLDISNAFLHSHLDEENIYVPA